MERHFIWDNKEQLKFTIPSTVTTVEKPHSYYAQISEIYTHEKQPSGVPFNEPFLVCDFDEKEAVYSYLPHFNGENADALLQ